MYRTKFIPKYDKQITSYVSH